MDCIRAFRYQRSALAPPWGLRKVSGASSLSIEDLTGPAVTLPERSCEVWRLPRNPDPGQPDYLADEGAHYATLLERADQCGGPIIGHCDEQPSARLRIVERKKVVLVHAIRRHTAFQVLPVAPQSARVDAF